MLRFVLTLICNAVALWVASAVVPGITLREATRIYAETAGGTQDALTTSTVFALLLVALVFTAVNFAVKPFVQVISLPLTFLTLGLFLLVINALMLMLTSWITTTLKPLGAEYLVSGFWAAFIGGIVIGLVNWVLGMLLQPRR